MCCGKLIAPGLTDDSERKPVASPRHRPSQPFQRKPLHQQRQGSRLTHHCEDSWRRKSSNSGIDHLGTAMGAFVTRVRTAGNDVKFIWALYRCNCNDIVVSDGQVRKSIGYLEFPLLSS